MEGGWREGEGRVKGGGREGGWREGGGSEKGALNKKAAVHA
jgi:hypothetical protein